MKKGVYTLMITPFKSDYSLDEEAVRRMIRMQIEGGVQGVAPLGVTGENPLMDDDEKVRLVEVIVDEAKGKIEVIPDIVGVRVDKSIELMKRYADAGADAVMAYTPYLILPREEGHLDYYVQLADASPVPILLHSSKNRTGVELTADMTAKLAKHPNIVATKDGNKQLDNLAKLVYLTKDDDFLVFTSKDTTAYPTAAFGGAGVFSVVANIIPGQMSKMIGLALEGKIEEAKALHYEYFPVFEALRYETNPMPAKMALQLMGIIEGTLRPPMQRLNAKNTEAIRQMLIERGLL